MINKNSRLSSASKLAKYISRRVSGANTSNPGELQIYGAGALAVKTAPIKILRIIGHGTGKYNKPNSSYICRYILANQNPYNTTVDTTGVDIEVFARSYHPNDYTQPIGMQDLTKCLPYFAPNMYVTAVPMEFNGRVDLWTLDLFLLECNIPPVTL